MSTSSLFEHIIQYEAAEYAADEAVDTAQARMMASNLAHLADASSQVLVACPPVASGGGFQTSFSASGTFIVKLATFGPFFVRTKANGEAYRIRYRLHGRTVTASNDVEILVWAHERGASGRGWLREYESTGNAAVQLHTASSTTPAWLAPDAGNPVLDLSAESTRNAERSTSIRDEIGGRDATVVAPEVEISIFARRASGSSATAAEFFA